MLTTAHLLLDRHRWVAYELIYHHPAAMAMLDEQEVLRLGAGLDSWGAVDAFCRYIAGPAWQRRQLPDAVVASWASSSDRWWRRAALVSTVPLNLRAAGGTGDRTRTLAICLVLVDDRDDMVVKALSWAFRELTVWDPAAVQAFLDEHGDRVRGARPTRGVEQARHRPQGPSPLIGSSSAGDVHEVTSGVLTGAISGVVRSLWHCEGRHHARSAASSSQDRGRSSGMWSASSCRCRSPTRSPAGSSGSPGARSRPSAPTARRALVSCIRSGRARPAGSRPRPAGSRPVTSPTSRASPSRTGTRRRRSSRSRRRRLDRDHAEQAPRLAALHVDAATARLRPDRVPAGLARRPEVRGAATRRIDDRAHRHGLRRRAPAAVAPLTARCAGDVSVSRAALRRSR